MKTAKYWEIELGGSEVDLKLITDLNNESFTISFDQNRYLLKFPAIPDEQSGDAFARGREMVISLNGLCRLRFPGFGNLSAEQVIRNENSDGSRGTTIMVKTAEIKIRTFPVTITAGGVTTKPIDVVNARLSTAISIPEVARVLRLRNTENLDWSQMYRVLEAVESDRDIVEAGWITKKQRNLFKHTANSVTASGDKARHGREVHDPPKSPMSEETAKTLLDKIIANWIDEKDSSKRS